MSRRTRRLDRPHPAPHPAARWSGIARGGLSILFSVLASLALPAVAAAGMATGAGVWEWQSPLPQGNRLTAVEAAPGGALWAVGAAGTLLRSEDGGASWVSSGPKLDTDLLDVDFVDGLTGWAVGRDGQCLHTVDGGASWERRTIAAADLTAVQFVSPTAGFVARDDGAVMRTGDAGSTWSEHVVSGASSLTDLSFVDATTGWACGPWGTVFATTDGGATWVQRASAGAADLYGIAFADAQTGWAVGDGDLIWGTADGGETWSVQYDGDGRWFGDVDALATSAAVAVGEGGLAVVKTPSQDWTPVPTQRGDWLHGVVWYSPSHAVAVGDDGAITVSTDGCEQFVSRSGDTDRTIEAVAAVHDGKAVAVGMSGLALYTNDGATWVRLPAALCYETLLDVSMGDGTHGCAVGEWGTVFTTDDGGLSWTRRASGTIARLEGVCMVSPAQGWAVGTDGRIFHTVDGGVSWTLQTPELDDSNIWFTDVDFVDDQHGWAVADRGNIWTTATGGADPDDAGPLRGWTQQPGPGYDLNAVDFVSPTHGWAVGDAATIVHTEDGGQTWIAQEPGFLWTVGTDFTGVAFADELNGWVVGTTGVVLVTHDGGATWVLQTAGGRPWFTDIAVVDTLDGPHAWAVGRRLAVLALRTRPETAPPETVDDAPAGWSRAAVTVTFTPCDDESGVARVTSRVDGGAWQLGATRVVPAPADHANDGAHVVDYFSEDHAGNREVPKSCTVRIDTRRPVCTAPYAASVVRGRYVTLRYRVNDAGANAGWAAPTLTVKTLAGKTLRTFTPGKKPVGTLLGQRFRCTLARGTYRFVVSAVDAAGNRQASTASNRLVVR